MNKTFVCITRIKWHPRVKCGTRLEYMRGLRFEHFCWTFLFSLLFIRITVWNIKPDLFIRRKNQGYKGTTWYAVTSLAPYMSFDTNDHSSREAIICAKYISYACKFIELMHAEDQHNHASNGTMDALASFSMFKNQSQVWYKILNGAFSYVSLKQQKAYEVFLSPCQS